MLPKLNFAALRSVSLDYVCSALNRLCRFQGRTPFFYSVLQHSYYVSIVAEENGFDTIVQLAALFHDFSEVVIGDWHGGVKKQLNSVFNISAVEQRIVEEFLKTFCGSKFFKEYSKRKAEILESIEICDKFLVAKELETFNLVEFFAKKSDPYRKYRNALQTSITVKREKSVKKMFLRRYKKLLAQFLLETKIKG